MPFVRNIIAEKLNASEEWQSVELWCAGRACRLMVNGGEVAAMTNLDVPLGSIGFSVADGAVEFKNIRILRTAPITDGFAKGAYMIDDDPDLKPPVVRREVKPQYTADAQAAKIQGTVLLACLVKEDGTVGDIAMLRSLDSRFGLDREAVRAARAWRFAAATLRGERVPMLVTIELTFRLR